MIDFNALNDALYNSALTVLQDICPGGRLIGKEYTAASKSGGHGDSFKYNIGKMRGSDFATSETFGDIVSLYAAIKGVSQIDSAKYLAERYCPSSIKQELQPIKTTSKPNMKHTQFGMPVGVWTYHSEHGDVLFYVARYNDDKGKKQFFPWTFNGKEWRCAGIAEPRPLYNLHKLSDKSKIVVICEGEKSSDAAEKIFGSEYVCTTWPNGSNAVDKADWSTLYGRSIIIWPDADDAGRKALDKIIQKLCGHCDNIKIVDTNNYPNKWDAADALTDGVQLSNLQISKYTKAELITTDNTPTEAGKVVLWKQLNLDFCDGKRPIGNADNVCRIISAMPEFKGKIWLDTFHNRVFTSWKTGNVREWSDSETIELMIFIQRIVGISKVGKEAIFDAVMSYAFQDIRNEPRDWMDSLVWDKSPKIEHFLASCAGAKETDYIRSVSTNFWISLVARIYNPGCKVDNMLILEGKQGAFKSTLFQEVGGKFFAEAPSDIKSVEFFKCIEGKMLIEFGELSSFSRSEVNHIKKIITCRSDRFRASYARLPADHPRSCVFTGTTNDDVYLTDPTGARRFWPVKITNINIDKIRKYRDQFFAEAVHLYKSGRTWWEVPDESKHEQEERRIHDEWESSVLTFLSDKSETTTLDIAKSLGISERDLDKNVQMRIANIIKVCGEFERQLVSKKGIKTRVWAKTAVTTFDE